MNLLNLNYLPLEAVLCVPKCHIPVWVKTAETISKFCVYGNSFALAPFFEQVVISPGCVIYIDGVNRIQLIRGRKRSEIQFGERPLWYYGEKLSKNQFIQLEEAQRAINTRKISVLDSSTAAAVDLFTSAKMERIKRFNRNFIAKQRSNNGVSFDPDNHALWPERAPGLFAMVETARTE